MPELPEAETLARHLRRSLLGARFGPIRHLREDVIRSGSGRQFCRVLPGRVVTAVRRRAKRIVLDIDADARLAFGLGMTGHVAVTPVDAPIAPHTHFRITVDGDARELRFRDVRRFGGIWLLAGEEADAGFSRLGPDPLKVGLATFRELLSRRRQVKALLLDQSVIAGLGNIYCDEALYRARIHPMAKAADLDPGQVARLHCVLKSLLRDAIAAKGSTVRDYVTAGGDRGSFQRRLRVYGREGSPCRRCGAAIRRIQAAGRSTHVCPLCQSK
jgi:formamidopyrimidine-DNA glycosylase